MYVLFFALLSLISSPLNADIPLSDPIPTTVKAQKKTIISGSMTGTIVLLSVKEGSDFKKGQVLIAFDCDIEKLKLEKARHRLVLEEEKFRSYKKLMRLGSISKLELAESKEALKQANANVSIGIKKAQYCQVIAPYDGHVVMLNVRNHETTKLHQELLTILSAKGTNVEVLVPSRWLHQLKKGQVFDVHINETNKTYQAEITRIVKKINAISQSIKVIAKIKNNDGSLIPGMSGNSYFTQRKHGR